MKMKRVRFVDKTFNGCVNLLERLAKRLNVTYEELNLIIFVIGWPAVTVGLIIANLKKRGK
ncbi:MAG: hypothetical protein D8M61_20860 [Ignavibacteriae bacterium]|nr:hypothetical protein [Ignavibacteriota bacterium]